MKPPLLFRLMRHSDISGVSGIGYVADGVTFFDGTTILKWRTKHSSLAVYPSLEEMLAVHGHDGNTVVEWKDLRN